MDFSSPPQLSIPRVRVSRNAHLNGDVSATPTAGPSRLSPHTYFPALNGASEDEMEDMDATPRLPVKSSLPSPSTATPTMQMLNTTYETPAERLRAILARVPDQTQLLHEPPPHTPSELESDFEPPKWNQSASKSIARESLKDLFSHARRDDTPDRKGRRRNSIDASEVEDSSPRVDRVASERAKNRGKRQSLSDEELDKSSKSASSLLPRTGSSHAMNIDALRSRLQNFAYRNSAESHTDKSMSDMDMSDGPGDKSNDTATLLRELDSSAASPPVATSTPMRSMQFPSMQNESNLLDQDSEMQRMMGATDSFEGDSGQQSQLAFPPPKSSKTPILAARSLASIGHTKSLSDVMGNGSSRTARNLSRRVSADSDAFLSHASDSLSSSDMKEDAHDRNLQSNRSNGDAPGTPIRDHYRHHRASHSQTGSPMPDLPLSRRGSVVSLRSVDSPTSSRATSSIGSNADYRDRIKDLERERNLDRERAWNKPKHSLSRTSSRSSLDLRERTHSTPKRPDSALSLLTPDRPHSSLSRASSRASSPNGSLHSVEQEEVQEISHERERNWNSPHPKWNHRRSVSPMPSPRPSPAPSPSHSRTRTRSLHTPATSPPAHLHHSTSSLSVHGHSPSPRPVSPSPSSRPRASSSLSFSDRSHSQNHSRAPAFSPRPTSPNPLLRSPRPNSPLPPTSRPANGTSNGKPAFGSLAGWQFPRKSAPLPPLELDHPSPERPSRIPVPKRSPPKAESVSKAESFRRGHKRATTEFSEAHGAIPPRIHIEAEPDHEPLDARSGSESGDTDRLFESDEDIHAAATPVMRPVVIPPIEDSEQEPPRSTTPLLPPPPPPEHAPADDFSRLQKALDASPPRAKTLPSSTPPSSPPKAAETPMFPLTTPPRRMSFNTPKIEFQTPSPPKGGLPPLPGPPSSDEDGDEDEERTPVREPLSFSSMKTPRPPGAWAATPAPARQASPAPSAASAASPSERKRSRANSLPQPPSTPSADENPSSSGTLAAATPRTPAASSSSLSPAHSLPTRTPAPPGAWLATPATLRRKSIMKVRFEVSASDSAVSEFGVVSPAAKTVPLLLEDGDQKSVEGPNGDGGEQSLSEPSFSGVVESSPVPQERVQDIALEPVSKPMPEPVTPARSPSPSSRRKLRKSPSVRLVDEYGREQSEASVNKKDVSASMRMPGGGPLATPRNKSAVRMLDAMGREVDEPAEANDSEDTVTERTPLPRREALARVKRAVAELQEGLSEVDRSDDLALDATRMGELHEVSRAARDARTRISSSLKQAQKAQAKLRNNYGPLRESMHSSQFMPNIMPARRWSWGLVFIYLVVLPVLIFLVIYRLSRQQATHQFLTTYYDPFYAELYLHPTKPEKLYDPTLFSFFRQSAPRVSDDTGVWGTLATTWHTVLDTIARWQRLAWDTWGISEQEQIRAMGSWPPT
ncbi:hypothetical protein DENSPDRAFT_883330 [Dentipellis sp. KUC8613]|nr:hypothetical protein DENSPDRAFT_883330 [Dentipellis sp. KUC8613]